MYVKVPYLVAVNNALIATFLIVKDEFWGTISNETADGMIGAVYTHDVEMGMGGIYKWFFEYSDYTNTIARSSVTLLVPEAL